ncbi:MAG: kinetochore-associated Ndc80 complex subunit spc24 [Bathelium mastoideum]|nr:MAG: kinetochore-associated Ndc80 complex subunit spc24 [Bathelium mastoideum]KAI9693164.1 MAG: kinetochore-associated Ndc80 complex subunit spc24 [Bathelium mastoideum]
MLLDEDPATLISECTSNFNIAPDRAALTRITTSLRTLTTARTLRTSSAGAALQRLDRQRATLDAQHALEAQQHDPTAHASRILALDTHKFRVAKQASEVEVEGARLAGELEGLRRVLGEVEARGVEGGGEGEGAREGEDETILKLKVYRSLGIDIEPDRESGAYNKAIIRNNQKGDVHVVNIDPKFSRFFYANYFWQTM